MENCVSRLLSANSVTFRGSKPGGSWVYRQRRDLLGASERHREIPDHATGFMDAPPLPHPLERRRSGVRDQQPLLGRAAPDSTASAHREDRRGNRGALQG
jgi:hypothetical protein